MSSRLAAPIHRLLLATEDMGLAASVCEALVDGAYLAGIVGSRGELLSSPHLADCDVVMVDEVIGAFDSWQCTRQIRDAAGNRPIVIVGLASRIDPDLVSRQREFGLAGFIRKTGIEKKLGDGLNILARNVPPRPGEPTDFYRELPALAAELRKADDEKGTDTWDTVDMPPPEMSAGRPSTPAPRPPPAGTAPGSPNLSGKTLGRVRLERIIGEGAGGTVYKALHTNLQMPVAVKVLHAELARSDADYAMRFLREARLSARVAHANVVRVLDCDRDEEGTGAYYIVMEFIQGRDLEKEVRTHGPISEERLTGIAIGVCHALVAAEEEHVIHRDIKPSNILLQKDDAVKVADLGLAQRAQPLSGLATSRGLEGIASGPSEISNQTIMGTPYYISPEQITDPGSCDVRSDIYGLGATLYFAATGDVPFPADNIAEVLLMHLESEPVPPIERNPNLTPAISRFVLKMMEKDREKRPAGHREVLSFFREHRQNLIDAKRWKRSNAIVRMVRSFFGKG